MISKVLMCCLTITTIVAKNDLPETRPSLLDIVPTCKCSIDRIMNKTWDDTDESNISEVISILSDGEPIQVDSETEMIHILAKSLIHKRDGHHNLLRCWIDSLAAFNTVNEIYNVLKASFKFDDDVITEVLEDVLPKFHTGPEAATYLEFYVKFVIPGKQMDMVKAVLDDLMKSHKNCLQLISKAVKASQSYPNDVPDKEISGKEQEEQDIETERRPAKDDASIIDENDVHV